MRLLERKKETKRMKELSLSETQWDGIAELTKVLGPANITSQVLQKE
jgi:hypothetical protein